jgi:endonuclease III
METADTHFFRAVARYRITDHKLDEDIKEELGIADTNTATKNMSNKMARTFENKCLKPKPQAILAI